MADDDANASAGGPVFIVGASRSGTAMLRSMLNNSSDLHIAGETHYFDDLRTMLGDGATTPLSAADRQRAMEYFLPLSHRPYGHAGTMEGARVDADALARRATELGDTGDAWFRAFCELHATIDGDTVAPRWGEKTPRHLFRLPEMLSTYPDARVVVMVRDPRAVGASYMHWSNRGGLDLTEDYERAMEVEESRTSASWDPTVSALLWRGGVRAAAAARREYGPSRVRIQQYEALVTDPRPQLDEIGAFLDLPTDESMLDVPMHNSSFSDFDRAGGISAEAVSRWRGRLPEQDVATIEFWAGREMTASGYELDSGDLGLVRRGRVVASGAISSFRAVLANRDRAGSLPGYVIRRARSAFGR